MEVVNITEDQEEVLLGTVRIPLSEVLEERTLKRWIPINDHDQTRNFGYAKISLKIEVEHLPSNGVQNYVRGNQDKSRSGNLREKLEGLKNDLEDYKSQQIIIRQLAPPLVQNTLPPMEPQGYLQPKSYEEKEKKYGFVTVDYNKEAGSDYKGIGFMPGNSKLESGAQEEAPFLRPSEGANNKFRLFVAFVLIWLLLSFFTTAFRPTFVDVFPFRLSFTPSVLSHWSSHYFFFSFSNSAF